MTKAITASVPYDVTFKGANLSLVWEGAASELKFANNVEARFGANTNLRVYYDNASAGTSYIRSGAATDLVIMGGSNVDVAIKGDNGVNTGKVNYFLAEGSTGEASLHFYGNEKLATKTTGVDITGNITVSGTVDGILIRYSQKLRLPFNLAKSKVSSFAFPFSLRCFL